VDIVSSTVNKSQFLTFASTVLILDLLSLSKMKVQDFRAALRDDEVKSLFIEIFNEKIEQCVRTNSATLFADIMDKFTKKFDELNINLISLRAEVQRKDVVIGQLTTENQQLKATVQSLTVKMDEAEAYQRRDNLVLTGLEVRAADVVAGSSDPLTQPSVSIIQKVTDFCTNVLKCRVNPVDISTAHLLPVKDATRPAVIVRFVRRTVRDEVFAARHQLKSYTTPTGNKVYVNEDLTATNRRILAALRLKVRNKVIQGAWSQSGRIMAKDLRGGTPKHITTLDEAHSFA
jgi:hypothetical protein